MIGENIFGIYSYGGEKGDGRKLSELLSVFEVWLLGSVLFFFCYGSFLYLQERN